MILSVGRPCLLTVYALLVGKSLALLRLVPVQDQAVAEGQRSSSVGCRLVAVEKGTRKSGLNVTHSIFGEVISRGEGLGHLIETLINAQFLHAIPRGCAGRCQLTYKLPPGLTLGLWNACFDALDITGAEAGHRPLVLRTSEARSNGALELGKRGARRGLALAGSWIGSSHLDDVNCSEARIAKGVSVGERRWRGGGANGCSFGERSALQDVEAYKAASRWRAVFTVFTAILAYTPLPGRRVEKTTIRDNSPRNQERR